MTTIARKTKSRLEMTGEIVRSEQLQKGMIVNKQPYATRGFELVDKRTGFCDKGFHYGNGCFDRIAEWFVYVKVENRERLPRVQPTHYNRA